jgi:hypothetical protein
LRYKSALITHGYGLGVKHMGWLKGTALIDLKKLSICLKNVDKDWQGPSTNYLVFEQL